jgi:flagellar assembly protein FliH
LSRIFKSVSRRETPLVLAHALPAGAEPEAGAGPDAGPQDAAVDGRLTAAESEAREMMAAAREQAAALVAAAEEQAAAIRREAYDESYRQGFAEGQAHGEAAAREQAAGDLAAAAGRAEDMLAVARKQATEELQAAERQLVELALAVAAKILAREGAENPTAVLPMVKEALAKVRDQEQVTVRVNPASYDFLLAARPELQAALAGDVALTVAADSSLKEGDCVVETPFGTVDARIDTQLELVRAALRDVMP